MVPVISVVGKSGVGKTYVVTRIVSELKKRSYSVATIKHSAHDVDLDLEGKDSWHHARAGSDAVVISSPHRFALIKNVDHDSTPGELSRFIGSDYDIVIAEGYKQGTDVKIELHRKGYGPESIAKTDRLLAVVTDERLDLDVPQYSWEDMPALVDLIEKTYLRRTREPVISLFVNGKPVPLNDFVKKMFSNILRGMVSSLKRIPQVERIDISLRENNRR